MDVGKLGKLKAKLAEISNQIDDADARRADAKSSMIEASSRLEKGESEVASIERRIQLLEKDLADVNGRNETLEGRLHDVETNCTSIEEARKQLEENESTGDEKLQQVEESLKAAVMAKEEARTKHTEASRKLVVVNRDLERMTEKVDSAQKRNKVLEETIMKATEEIRALEEMEGEKAAAAAELE